MLRKITSLILKSIKSMITQLYGHSKKDNNSFLNSWIISDKQRFWYRLTDWLRRKFLWHSLYMNRFIGRFNLPCSAIRSFSTPFHRIRYSRNAILRKLKRFFENTMERHFLLPSELCSQDNAACLTSRH